MASLDQVKLYLVRWLQLGKKLVRGDGQEVEFTQSVIDCDRYSGEFERCWQEILDHQGNDFYLEGTDLGFDSLFSSQWNISKCARCSMPVPSLELGVQAPGCPCDDLLLWPNVELPLPRAPINNHSRLTDIKSRLLNKTGNY